MVEFTEEQKKSIFDRMADEHTTPDVLAKEFKCKLADIMDAVVDVIAGNGETKTYIPETSLDDGDDMVEFTKSTKTEKKHSDKKSKTRKWTDALGVKVEAKKAETPLGDNGISFKIEKIDLNEHPELKTAVDGFFGVVENTTDKEAEPKCECKCNKQHEPISVDKLGALAYRLSKLHMSEEMIIKVLNIVLGVPEPTIREALK